MSLQSIFDAVVLGIVEGVTEFVPVSSTAHLLLSTELLGLGGDDKAFWDTFNVMIQLGAILAVVVVYFGRLWGVLLALPSDPAARRFVISVVVAFLPSAVVGLLLHDFIKTVLFNSPILICIVASFFWFLPVIGVEFLPIGLLLIAQDVPFLRRPVARLMLWLEERWRALRRRFRRRR